eukprot:TRINITY_DN7095_c0_g1_i4.p1 TRINITY_DN7095_c0_g1~~TRINITY_DN7095_c0_g1_i4.p1  ORF type:complete len:307 (-),score=102.09 TRINITY_DN7095_c0_g1_i4:23-943(-)
MVYLHDHKKSKKHKKHADGVAGKGAAPVAPKADAKPASALTTIDDDDDDLDDIFPDAGGYVFKPTAITKKATSVPDDAAKKAAEYFDPLLAEVDMELEMDDDVEEEAADTKAVNSDAPTLPGYASKREQDAHYANAQQESYDAVRRMKAKAAAGTTAPRGESVFRRDDKSLSKRRERDEREKDVAFVSENYTECYPGAYEGSAVAEEVYSDDDEEDLTKMDPGTAKKNQLHWWDFESEDDWKAYMETREATPKAAFQFGVKMSDGRKSRKISKQAKLNQQMQKINHLLEKRPRDSSEESGSKRRRT